jgi:thiol-disulfide isomerase/thioredoxin
VPEFNLKIANNTTLKVIADPKGWKFEGLEGKVVLLDFFGTWCPPCKAEIPHLNDIREKLKKKFEIVGIDIGSRSGEPTSDEDMEEFIYEFNIKYIVSHSGDNIKLYQALGELNPRGSIPFMVLLNQKGQYVTHYIGMVPQEMIQSDINKLLGK